MTARQPVCTLIKFSEFSIDPTGQQADKLVGFFLNERLTTESLFERIENRSVCFTNFKQSNLSDLFVIGQIHLTGFAIFCIFVKNTIYVLGIEVLQLVLLARYSKKEAEHNFCDIILPYHNFA